MACEARVLPRRPRPDEVEAFRREQARRDFSYAAVGATRTTPPPGHTVDRSRALLGRGAAVAAAARQALASWRMFDLGWVTVSPPDAPIATGSTVAVTARAGPLWTLNACRIVYVVDEERRFGFAYGTLPGHAERGEERFLVERDRSDEVWYDILAFSRPYHWLVRLAHPLTRLYQRRFARDSLAAMRRAAAGPVSR